MKQAKAGETIAAKAQAAFKKAFRFELPEKVSAPCGAADGQWICVTCGKVFANNSQMQGHTKGHSLAWRCQCGQIEQVVP